VTLDRELEPLVAALEGAGARARARLEANGANAPDAGFATALRARLLSDFPAAAGASAASEAGIDRALAGRASAEPADQHPGAPVAAIDGAPVRLAAERTATDEQRSSVRPWAILATAAVVVLAVAGLDLGIGFPARPAAQAADAVGTVLHRAETARPLVAGIALEPGDVIRVGPGGQALINLAGGQVRLAEGAVLELDRLEPGRIELAQRAGRAYHRVAVEPGATYQVHTASITWTARGTAFDLDRGAEGAAGTQIVRERSVEHDVRLEGPGLASTIAEGQGAIVRLSEGDAELTAATLTAADLADPWLLSNARRDLEAGHAIGVLAGLALVPPPAPPSMTPATMPPTASPAPAAAAPTAPPTAAATVSPTVRPSPTAKATPKATAKPTPSPTASPTSAPTAAPTLGTLSLTLTPCDGSFAVASWTKWLGSGFHHYQGLRSASSSIPTGWPPPPDVAAPKGLHSSVVTTVNGIDTGLAEGTTAWYRVVAYDAANGPLAASAAASAAVKPAKALGGLSVETPAPGSTSFAWTAYGGPGACFSYYKLVYSESDPTPSYLDGDPYLWASGAKSDAGAVLEGVPAGTWWFRLQALRDTPAGPQLVAQTDATSFTVP
jgi:hypothetical protein